MGKPASPRCPVSVPYPLVVIGVDLFEPAVGCKDVSLAVAVDVGDADAVTVLLAASEMVDAWLVGAEVDPDDTGTVVVGEGEVGFAIAVDVCEGATLGVVAVGDLFGLPQGAGGGGLGAGIAVPPEAVRDPAGGDEVGQAIVVDVDNPLPAVADELIVDADGAELMLLPFSAVCAGVLVPIGTAENIDEAIVVHVEEGDALGVVGSETVDEKSDSRLSIGAVAGVLHADFGCVCGVLGLARTADE